MSLGLQTNEATNSPEPEPAPDPVPDPDLATGSDIFYCILATLNHIIKTKEELRKVETNKQICEDTLQKSQRIIEFVTKELEQSKNAEEPDHTSLNAAIVELQGKQVPAAYQLGRIFDHVMKVHEKVRALEKNRTKIDRQINEFKRLQQMCESREALELLDDGRVLELQMMLNKLDSKIQYYRQLVPEGSKIDKEHAENLIRQYEELKLKQRQEQERQQERQQAILDRQNSRAYRFQEAMKKTLIRDAPNIAVATVFREIGLILSDTRSYSSLSQAYDRISRQLIKQLSIGCSASFLAYYLKSNTVHPYFTAFFTALWTLQDGLGKGHSWLELAARFGADLGSSIGVMYLAKILNKRVMVVSTLVSSLLQSINILFDRQATALEKLKNVTKVTVISAGTVAGICAGEVVGSWVGGALGSALGPVGTVIGVGVGAFAGGLITGAVQKFTDWLFS